VRGGDPPRAAAAALFQSEPEIMGLTALLLLQQRARAARFDARARDPARRPGPRAVEQQMIAEGWR
jgi:predicted RNA polymerase sigma factor